jgi:hypothetical protein
MIRSTYPAARCHASYGCANLSSVARQADYTLSKILVEDCHYQIRLMIDEFRLLMCACLAQMLNFKLTSTINNQQSTINNQQSAINNRQSARINHSL